MNDTTITADFRPITFPATVDAPDAADFIEMMRVRNLAYAELHPYNYLAMEPAELLPHYQPDEHELRYMWLVLVDGDVVGRVGVDIPFEDDSRAAYWSIELRPAFADRGIEDAAHDLIVETARTHDRTVLQSWVERAEAPGPRLEPPTGFGSVAAEDPFNRFLLDHGYSLEQVERVSHFVLDGAREHLQELLAEAEAAAEGYRIVQWTLPTPPEFLDATALMKSRMSTDAPAADLDVEEQVWDADRVVAHNSRYIDGGMTMQVTAAQHIASGALVAFNELVASGDLTAPSHQEDTLVLKEHRGHRLGLLVKVAGLLAWLDTVPDSPRVITYNAEENRPMLDINERIGFVPIAYEGAWKKVLA